MEDEMLNYKKIALSLSIIAGVGLGATTQANALFGLFSSKLSEDEIASKILATIGKHGKTEFCRKGDASKLVFSIRSFNGDAASVSKTLAALGMLVCSTENVEGFNSSQFHDKAVKKLGTTDMTEIQGIFVQGLKNARGKALALGCTLTTGGSMASGLAPVAAAVGSVCAKAGG